MKITEGTSYYFTTIDDIAVKIINGYFFYGKHDDVENFQK